MKKLIINPTLLGGTYPKIGDGYEGTVYNYNNKYALKTFERFRTEDRCGYKLARRMKKLEEMSELSDIPGCPLPRGVFGTPSEILGSYKNIVFTREGRKDFNCLMTMDDRYEVIRLLVEGDAILQRIHKSGMVVGDVLEQNILINDKGHAVFVDSDNFKYRNHFFEFYPTTAGFFYSAFSGNPKHLEDNDKLLYAVMALKALDGSESHFNICMDGPDLRYSLKSFRFDGEPFDKESMEQLLAIFSDAPDKPYVGPILKKLLK